VYTPRFLRSPWSLGSAIQVLCVALMGDDLRQAAPPCEPLSDPVPEWRRDVQREISELERAIDERRRALERVMALGDYLVVRCGYRTGDREFALAVIDSPAAKLYTSSQLEIRERIQCLWCLTLHCCFSDFEEAELISRAKEIADRYARLLASDEYPTQASLARVGLPDTIEQLDGPYVWPALQVLGGAVHWRTRPAPVTARGLTCLPIDVEVRGEIHAHFLRWWVERSDSLTWNERLRRFQQADGSPAEWPLCAQLLGRAIRSAVAAKDGRDGSRNLSGTNLDAEHGQRKAGSSGTPTGDP
jgi:hypothetical protein